MNANIKKILNWMAWILIALVIGLWLYKTGSPIKQLPMPGEEISGLMGTCWGQEVERFGKPNYAADPNMQHMKGEPCMTPEQCKNWPPEGAPTEGLYCCVPLGECVRNI